MTIAKKQLTCKFARRALTLVEILVATTLSLLLILAVAQSFATVGQTISDGRASLEMAERMRNTVATVTTDLDSVSVPSLPWIEPAYGAGYLEIVEGWMRDYDANANNLPDWQEASFDTSWGDGDDILAMTVINQTTPFVGYVMGTLTPNPIRPGKFNLTFDPAFPRTRTKIISNAAEIIWWTTLNDTNNDGIRDPNENFTLHRRVLLIRPDIEIQPSLNLASMSYPFFLWGNDLSVFVDPTDPTGTRQTNSLQDLSNRYRRTAHPIVTANPFVAPLYNFPYPLNRLFLLPQKNVWIPGPDGQWGVSGVDDDNDGTTDGADIDEAGAIESDDLLIAENEGQDVILSQVLSFDVKVFDPMAPLKDSVNGIDMLGPGDPRYIQLNALATGAGEFVDLGYALNPLNGVPYSIPFASAFSGQPKVRYIATQLPYTSPTWDTWPTIYEMDGLNQGDAPGPARIDEGYDGIDNDGVNGVDDVEERETMPPYSSPLRGVKVILRAMDQTTRQVRQEHVVSNLNPD